MTSTPSAQSQTDPSEANGDLSPSHPVRQCLHWLLARPLLRLGVASAVATAVNYGTFYLIHRLLPDRPLFVAASVAIGYVTGIFINFYLSRLLVFGASQYHIGVEFAMVTIINLIGLALTEATTMALTTLCRFSPPPRLCAGTGGQLPLERLRAHVPDLPAQTIDAGKRIVTLCPSTHPLASPAF